MKRINSASSLVALVAAGLACLAPTVLSGCSATGADPSADADADSVEQAFGSLPGFVTSIKPYIVAVTPEYAFQPLLSVGDRVPRTSDVLAFTLPMCWAGRSTAPAACRKRCHTPVSR